MAASETTASPTTTAESKTSAAPTTTKHVKITTSPTLTYLCTGVHLVHADDQCIGLKNYLATFDAVVKDRENWEGLMNQW